MFFLIISIVLTSYLTLSFKVVQRFNLNNLQVIVFNYFTCVITGSILNGRFPITSGNVQSEWFPWACGMGAMFIILFNIIGYSAQRISVAVTSVANKLSLVIPFLFSLYLYDEHATFIRILGIALALIAVLLTCYRKRVVAGVKPVTVFLYFLPFILFIGSGLLDTMIKFVEHRFLNDNNKDDFLILAFLFAAVIGLIAVLIQQLVTKSKISRKAIVAGIAIGIPNYFSIWCLIKVLKLYEGSSSAIIPINNMGIVLFSSVAAWWIFKERLSILNWTGVFLSIIAIALIAYG